MGMVGDLIKGLKNCPKALINVLRLDENVISYGVIKLVDNIETELQKKQKDNSELGGLHKVIGKDHLDWFCCKAYPFTSPLLFLAVPA